MITAISDFRLNNSKQITFTGNLSQAGGKIGKAAKETLALGSASLFICSDLAPPVIAAPILTSIIAAGAVLWKAFKNK